jgi:Tfp pilus assembly protein PilE
MRAALGLVGLLIVLVIGYLIYSTQIRSVSNDKPLVQQINLVAVRCDLLSLGQAEGLYLASNGSYANLEQLRSSNIMNSFPEGGRSGYRYTAEVDGAAHFRITASPTDSSKADLSTLSIDETLQISQ